MRVRCNPWAAKWILPRAGLDSRGADACCVLTIADKNVREENPWRTIAKTELIEIKGFTNNSLSMACHLPMLHSCIACATGKP